MPTLHPVLRLIYLLLRLISAVSTTVFYRRRIVLGRKYLNFRGPAIVISNHPSTLMEPLNVGIHVRQEIFFLANYGLFKHPVSNWILTRLFCIPVKRREDVAEGEARNNDEAFEQCFRHLEKKGVLYIAPEGTSWMNRWVRDFKTGTARIAFGTESRNNWQLGTRIVPVGLSYSAANLFRSDMVVQFGEPIVVSDWATAWQQDPDQAVEDLTVELQRRVTALTIHTRDEAGAQFISTLEEIAQTEMPVPLKEAFRRSQLFTEQHLDNEALRAKTAAYQVALNTSGITDAGLKNYLVPPASGRIFLEKMLLAAGFVPFAIGYGCWFLPCYLPWLLAKKLKLYVGYDSNVKVMAGMITFPLALWTASTLLHWVGMFRTWPPSLIWLVLAALGLFAEQYLDVWQRVREQWKAAHFAKKNSVYVEVLKAMRNGIVEEAFTQEEAPAAEFAQKGFASRKKLP